MKKIILLTLMTIAPLSNLLAQKPKRESSFYIRTGAGYSFPLGGDYTFFQGIPVNGTAVVTASSNSGSTARYDLQRASFGAGTTGVAGLGYMFNKHLGIDVSVSLGISMKKYKYKRSSPADVDDYVATRITYAKMPVVVMPSLIISTGGENITGYIRGGVAVATGGKFIINDDISYFPPTVIQTAEVKTKSSLGITSAMGIKYNLLEGFATWLEANALFMELKARSATVTRYDVNGISRLDQLTASQRETVYSEKFMYSYPTTNVNAPYQAFPISASFSNWGISAGISIEL